MKLTMRDWETGQIQGVYDLSDYEKEWGRVYWMLHRQDMHKVLLEAATSAEGLGIPCQVHNNSVYVSIRPHHAILTERLAATLLISRRTLSSS